MSDEEDREYAREKLGLVYAIDGIYWQEYEGWRVYLMRPGDHRSVELHEFAVNWTPAEGPE